MSVFVSTRLFGIIAFIMVFTYFAEGIMFLDVNGQPLNEDFNNIVNGGATLESIIPLSKVDWMNLQFRIAYDIKYNHDSNHLMDKYPNDYSQTAINIMMNYDLTQFNDGWYFWQHNSFHIMTNDYNDIYYAFRDYVEERGYSVVDETLNAPHQNNLLENAFEFLGRIPTYFGNFLNLITFNIQNQYGVTVIPDSIRAIALIFFVPMWIIMGIEILPVITKIIEAIGSIIPF